MNMRKGAKWSDGTPFTADDILFWYKDCPAEQGPYTVDPELDEKPGRLSGDR